MFARTTGLRSPNSSVRGQQSYVRNGTIRGNITYALGEVPDHLVRDAARRARLHDELPGAYNTMRAWLGRRTDPADGNRPSAATVSVLILNEPTHRWTTAPGGPSASDEEISDVVVIELAHRLSTLGNADAIHT